MFTLLLIGNALFTITWLMRNMLNGDNPAAAIAAFVWLLCYLWAPEALLVTTALITPGYWLVNYFRRAITNVAYRPTYIGTKVATGFAVPQPSNDMPTAYPARCFTCG